MSTAGIELSTKGAYITSFVDGQANECDDHHNIGYKGWMHPPNG
jgi:hypothetical protein